MSNLFEFARNIKSFVEIAYLDKIIRYIKLFGLKATLHEFKRKLLADGYLFYHKSKVIQIKTTYASYIKHPALNISVVIPTKNAGPEFKDLLSSLNKQKGFNNIEIIVVDSGSKDNTISIAESHKAKVVRINPENFTHSYSRNIGADNSSGDYILFTVQDAYPTHDSWLYDLLNIMIETDVSAISSMEIPRQDSDLFYRAIIWNHSLFMETNQYGKIMEKPEYENYISIRKNAQLNNVACLVSRDIFFKYLFVSEYAEDLDFGIRLIRDGHRLALTKNPQIIHSHNRPPYYHLKRGYIEQISYSKLFPDLPVLSNNLAQTIMDILFVYRTLCTIVIIKLATFKLPCKVSTLSRFIINTLNNPQKLPANNLEKYSVNKYLDEDTQLFLKSVTANLPSNKNIVPIDCLLLDIVRSYLMIILEYVDNNYNLIDNKSIEEINSSIFKSFALISGKFLGSCFINDTNKKIKYIKEIDQELRKSI